MNELLGELQQSLADGGFVQLVLSRRVGSASDRVPTAVTRMTYRPVLLKSGPHVQVTLTERTRETHRNLTPEEVIGDVQSHFGTTFGDCNLFTATADIAAQVRSNGGVKLSRRAPSKAPRTQSMIHNRTKQYLIPDGKPCAFLIEIGVMTPDGKVRAAKYDKFRQVNRFLELVDDVLSELPATGTLRVVDFGCGKSYLTFALHYLLTEIRQRDVEIIGLDLKREVIDHCEAVARKLDCRGLSFRVGDIAAHSHEGDVALTVSLHACDTATDAALAKAVGWNAQVILCVPCCQHEFNAAMTGSLLQPLLNHGILRERFAALATDALRAQALEILGYRTQVIEFIDLEHTPKNLLIRAVRRASPTPSLGELIHNYQKCKAELGLTDIALELLLPEAQRQLLQHAQLNHSDT